MKFIQNFIWELLTDPFAYALTVFIVLFYFKLHGVAAFSMISILFFGELVKVYLNKRKKIILFSGLYSVILNLVILCGLCLVFIF